MARRAQSSASTALQAAECPRFLHALSCGIGSANSRLQRLGFPKAAPISRFGLLTVGLSRENGLLAGDDLPNRDAIVRQLAPVIQRLAGDN